MRVKLGRYSHYNQLQSFTLVVSQMDVLPDLRSDMNELLNVGETSISDSIIVVSLNSVTGKDSERVKQLFMATGVFAEGAVLNMCCTCMTISLINRSKDPVTRLPNSPRCLRGIEQGQRCNARSDIYYQKVDCIAGQKEPASGTR